MSDNATEAPLASDSRAVKRRTTAGTGSWGYESATRFTPRDTTATADLQGRLTHPAGRHLGRNGSRQRIIVRAGMDGIALLCAVAVGYVMAEGMRAILLTKDTPISLYSTFPATLVLLIPALVIFTLSQLKGHYTRCRPFWTETAEQLKAIGLATAFITFVLFATKLDFSRTWTLCFLTTACLTLPSGRVLARYWLMKRGWWYKPAIIVADSDLAYHNAVSVTDVPDMGLKAVLRVPLQDTDCIKALADALKRIGRFPDDGAFGYFDERPHIIVAVSDMNQFLASKKQFDRLMQACPVLTFLPPMNEMPLYHSELMPLFRRDNVVIWLHNGLERRSSRVMKRAIDVVLGCTAGLLLIPVLLSIALLVRRDGGKAIYAQERIGAGGRRFKCLKFRTMVVDADEVLRELLEKDEAAALSWRLDRKLKYDPRTTKIGQLLRETSLDELPQLLNVLRGEMSFVGPRPIVQEEVERYGSSFEYYCTAKPGITGLWQVSGRNDVNYAERVRLDVWYVRNWSPWLDVVILFKTLPIVIFRSGAY